MRLWYFLRFDSPQMNEISKEWEEQASAWVRENCYDHPTIRVADFF